MTEQTVRERASALGYDLTANECRRLGDLVANEWARRHGARPQKKLSEKEGRSGTHQLAHYPETFWPTMDRIIESASPTRRRGFFTRLNPDRRRRDYGG